MMRSYISLDKWLLYKQFQVNCFNTAKTTIGINLLLQAESIMNKLDQGPYHNSLKGGVG